MTRSDAVTFDHDEPSDDGFGNAEHAGAFPLSTEAVMWWYVSFKIAEWLHSPLMFVRSFWIAILYFFVAIVIVVLVARKSKRPPQG